MASGLTVRAENPVRSTAPSYSAASVVNAADFAAGSLAPNSLATVFGTDLSFDPDGSALGLLHVKVYLNFSEATLLYVSASQINFLVPSATAPGVSVLRVVRQNVTGPEAAVTITDVAPALFRMPGTDPLALAVHKDNITIITAAAPASPGEIIVLYAAGLGSTNPAFPATGAPTVALPLTRLADLRVLLNGVAVDTSRVLYAGVTPGFQGLYQVNVRLPDDAPSNPEIRLAIGDQQSAAGLKLPLQ